MSFGYQVLGFGSSATHGGLEIEYIGGYGNGQTVVATEVGDIVIFFGGSVGTPSGSYSLTMTNEVFLQGGTWSGTNRVHIRAAIRRVASDGEAYPEHSGLASNIEYAVHLRPKAADATMTVRDTENDAGSPNTPTISLNAADNTTAGVKGFICFGFSQAWDQGGTRSVSQTMDQGGTFEDNGTFKSYGVVAYNKADALNVVFSGGYADETATNRNYSPAMGYLIEIS
tara:strand:+ start:12 stop:692 length:681 start_codon:yes stop_codon:yes gene_type:complete